METIFWNRHESAGLLVIPLYRELYDKDKSKNKIASSTMMWAIYYVYDYYSPFVELPMSIKIPNIEEGLFGSTGYFENNRDYLAPYIDKYNELQTTSTRKYFVIFSNQIEKRAEFLERTEYNEKTAKLLDTMLKDSVSIFNQEREIKSMLAEKNEGIIKGGDSRSMFEKGLLKYMTEEEYDKQKNSNSKPHSRKNT